MVYAPQFPPKGGDGAENISHPVALAGLVIVPVGAAGAVMVPGGTPSLVADRPAPGAPRRTASGRRFFPLPALGVDPAVAHLVFTDPTDA